MSCPWRPSRNLDLNSLFHVLFDRNGKSSRRMAAISAYRKPAIMVQWRLIVADKVEGVVRTNFLTIKLRVSGLAAGPGLLPRLCLNAGARSPLLKFLSLRKRGSCHLPTWLKYWFSHLVDSLRLILRFFHEDDNVVQLLLGLFLSYLYQLTSVTCRVLATHSHSQHVWSKRA